MIELIYHCRVKDAELLPGRNNDRPGTSLAIQKLVHDPHVGKRSPHHHLVVATAATIGAEVLGVHVMLEQILGRRGALGDLPRIGNVVRGDAVAKVEQAVGLPHRGRTRWHHGHALKVAGVADVGGVIVPWVQRFLWNQKLVPPMVVFHDGLVHFLKQECLHAGLDSLIDFLV